MKIVDYIEGDIPDWSLSLLVNGDGSGIDDDDDEKEALDWYNGCVAHLKEKYPDAVCHFDYASNQEPSFTHNPEFGLATNCIPGAVFAMVDNDSPLPAIDLPDWAKGPEAESEEDQTQPTPAQYAKFRGGSGPGGLDDGVQESAARLAAKLLNSPTPVVESGVTREWEFDSHMIISHRGEERQVQVWSRPSGQWSDTRDWTFTEDTPGKENPPPVGCGHYTSTENFKKAYPQFNRTDS